MNTYIYDLDEYATNERNGTYGGKAGEKEGININGEPWIVKYPKSTRGMRGDLDSYTTSPLSEYIGSHIYQMIGIDAHDTILGYRNNQIVVACKDFCQHSGDLREIRTLKNIYNKELADRLETSISSTSDSHLIDLEDMKIHFEFNPILKILPEVQTRFWDQIIVDGLIGNNDRNNGNWGILLEDGEYKLAPVFDNGASFSNKLPDRKIKDMLQSPERLNKSLEMTKTIYQIDGKQLFVKDLINIDDRGFYDSIIRKIPIIAERITEIKRFISDIPQMYNGLIVCSDERKEFYSFCVEERFKQYLVPVLEKTDKELGIERNVLLSLEKQKDNHGIERE